MVDYDLTVHEVALLCDVKDYTVREWIYEGKIHFIKYPDILPSIRISRTSLLDFASNYHNGKYYIDTDMIEWMIHAPIEMSCHHPMFSKHDIDNEIKKILKEYKEEKRANQTNTSQL